MGTSDVFQVLNICNCNFSLKTLPRRSGLQFFYKDMLSAWQRIMAHALLSKSEVENETIWNNKILLQLQSVFY